MAFRKEEMALYLEGWGKNEFENIKDYFLKKLKKLAKIYFSLDEEGIQAAIQSRALREIEKDQING